MGSQHIPHNLEATPPDTKRHRHLSNTTPLAISITTNSNNNGVNPAPKPLPPNPQPSLLPNLKDILNLIVADSSKVNPREDSLKPEAANLK